MNYFKKKLALLLCMLLVIPTIFECLPCNTQSVEAASITYYIGVNPNIGSWDYKTNVTTYAFNVEKGQTVNFGDMGYLSYYDANSNYIRKPWEQISTTSYKSSNTSVASPTKKGVTKMKKTGTTNITVKCKGKSVKIKVNVVAAGSLGSTKSMYSTLKKKVESLTKAYGTGITAKNGYKVNNSLRALYTYYSSLTGKTSYNLTLSNYGFSPDKTNGNDLIVPAMLKYASVQIAISRYESGNNPLSTRSSKTFKISKITGKSNKSAVTVTLKSKVTADQILALKYYQDTDTYMTNTKTVIFPVYFKDVKTGHIYAGRAVAKEGSKTLAVTMNHLKLVKGKTYKMVDRVSYIQIGTDAQIWTKGKTFKAS